MNKLLYTLLILVGLISCNSTKKDSSKTNFQIDVSINDVPDGRKAILKKQFDREIINIDTATIKNGKFSFKGSIKEPLIFGIFIDSLKRGGIYPFVNLNDHVTVVAYKDSLVKSKISGSKLHDELTRLRKKRDELTKQTKKFLPGFQKANQENDTVTINRINKEVKKISTKLDLNDWNYVKTHPSSYVTPLVFNGLMTKREYKDSIQVVFDSFDDKIKNSDLAKPIRDYFEFLEKQKTKENKAPSQHGKIKTH